MGYRSAEGRRKRDHGCDVVRSLAGNRARNYPAQTVSNQMDLPSRLLKSFFDGFIKIDAGSGDSDTPH